MRGVENDYVDTHIMMNQKKRDNNMVLAFAEAEATSLIIIVEGVLLHYYITDFFELPDLGLVQESNTRRSWENLNQCYPIHTLAHFPFN